MPIHVTDLPDALLDMIFRALPGSSRCVAARACTAFRRAHHECKWFTLRCSMHTLVRRGRYCDMPHWSSDLVAVYRTLGRPPLTHLRRVMLLLDTPCFETRSSMCANTAAFLPRPGHRTVEQIVVRAVRHNYAQPAAPALTRIVRYFPNARIIQLYGLKNVGVESLGAVFESRTVSSVTLGACTFTDAGRASLVDRFTVGTRAKWPVQLVSLALWGPGARAMLVRASRSLQRYGGESASLVLPPCIESLDLHDAWHALTDVQIATTLSNAPESLRKIVVWVRTPRVIEVVDAHRDAFFPQVGMHLVV